MSSRLKPGPQLTKALGEVRKLRWRFCQMRMILCKLLGLDIYDKAGGAKTFRKYANAIYVRSLMQVIDMAFYQKRSNIDQCQKEIL